MTVHRTHCSLREVRCVEHTSWPLQVDCTCEGGKERLACMWGGKGRGSDAIINQNAWCVIIWTSLIEHAGSEAASGGQYATNVLWTKLHNLCLQVR